MSPYLSSVLGIIGAVIGLVIGHVLSYNIRKVEWQREDELRTVRGEIPRVEFAVDINFLGVQGDDWLVELLALIDNKRLYHSNAVRLAVRAAMYLSK